MLTHRRCSLGVCCENGTMISPLHTIIINKFVDFLIYVVYGLVFIYSPCTGESYDGLKALTECFYTAFPFLYYFNWVLAVCWMPTRFYSVSFFLTSYHEKIQAYKPRKGFVPAMYSPYRRYGQCVKYHLQSTKEAELMFFGWCVFHTLVYLLGLAISCDMDHH